VNYIIGEFKKHLPGSCEELANDQKAMKQFEQKIGQLSNAKNPDAYGFIDYIVSKDLEAYIQTLKPKATKKKPLSFERLNMMVLPIFKYFENEKSTETAKNKKSLDLWVSYIISHKNINLNTMFEA
jgi:hypothetical protein